jgi:hypothetical protein
MQYMPHPLEVGMYSIVSNREEHIGRAEREILVLVLHINYFLKSPLYMAFPTAVDPADRVVGPLSPLPCHAWHGYGVSSAHHGEVRGCRRACKRTPLRGRRRCAAGGRHFINIMAKHGMTNCKPSPLPMDHGLMSGLTGVAKNVCPSLLGNMQDVNVCTRLDVSTPLSFLGSALAHPSEVHLQALKKAVHYLNGTIARRMTFGGGGWRTKASTSQASRMRIGPTITTRASPVRATCSHSAEAMPATRLA